MTDSGHNAGEIIPVSSYDPCRNLKIPRCNWLNPVSKLGTNGSAGNQTGPANPLPFFTQSLFEDSGSGPITRRKVPQKRSIHGVCEHFEVLSNAVSGPQTGYSNRLSFSNYRKYRPLSLKHS